MARVNAALRREIGALITVWLRDPRISRLTTVSRVTTARDLGKSTVYIVIHGTKEEREETLAALTSARVALRHVLKDKIRMRNIPQLVFRLDDVDEKSAGVLAILDQVAAELHDRADVSPDDKSGVAPDVKSGVVPDVKSRVVPDVVSGAGLVSGPASGSPTGSGDDTESNS